MEEHTRRVVPSVFDAIDRYRAREGTLSDIQMAAGAAADALDNANAPLRECLLGFDPDLEVARFGLPESEQEAVAMRLRERLERAAARL